MSNEKVEANVTFGEYPFPLIDGPEESRYLTWLRNHSNYMAARGFLDYLRSAGVLVRGIIVNFLIFLPLLLMVSIALGYNHHRMLTHPYWLTRWALVLAAVWILLFPILVQLLKIYNYKKSLETGIESSVKQRDLFERSFGGLLLVIFTVALLESLPWMLELFHELRHQGKLDWKGGLATVAAALAVLSGSDKLLSVLSGAKKELATVLIGILGLLVPVLVILYATDFLVYGLPPSPSVMFSPLVVAVVGVLGIMSAILLGLWRHAFSGKEYAAVFGMLVLGFILVLAVIRVGASAMGKVEDSRVDLDRTIEPLERVASAFDKISIKADMAKEVADLVDEVVFAKSEYNRMKKDIDDERKQQAYRELVSRASDNPDKTLFEDLKRVYPIYSIGKLAAKESEFLGRYFSSGQTLISLGDKLSAQSAGRLEPLRREIAKLAHDELLDELKKQVPVEQDFAELLRRKFVEQNLVELFQKEFDEVQKTLPMDLPEAPGDEAIGDFAKEVAHVRERLKRLVEQIDGSELVAKAIGKGKVALQNSTVEEIAKLVSEQQLAGVVEKKFENVPGKAKLARLTGKEQLAKLLSKEEILDLVFPEPTEEDIVKWTRSIFVDHALPHYEERDIEEKGRRLEAARKRRRLEAARKLAVLADFKEFKQPNSQKTPDEKSPGLVPATGSADLAPKKPALPSVENLSDEEIAKVAHVRLARLALADFDVQHLATVATEYSDLVYFVEFPVEDAKLREQKRTFKELEDLVTDLPLKGLAEHAFKVPPAKAEGANLLAREVVEWNYQFSEYDRYKLLLAKKCLHDDDALARLARERLVEKAIDVDSFAGAQTDEPQKARDKFSELGFPYDKESKQVMALNRDELARIVVVKFADPRSDALDNLVTKLIFGIHGRLEKGGLGSVKEKLTKAVITPKTIFVSLLAAVIWLACWLTVDVNQTSIHGLYRDRLAAAFLVGIDTKGDVGIEEDVDLEDICRYEARSTAPYHLINVALNLQGSKDIGIRDRKSDFFIFSKRFIGGQRTGYCRSEIMEQVYPQMSLSTAMAISAAAASPNMGRGTSPLLVAFMSMLNIRLGYWMPNPGLLEEQLNKPHWKIRKKDPKRAKDPLGFTFEEVFAQELQEIERRRGQVYPDAPQRHVHIMEDDTPATTPTTNPNRTPTATPTAARGLVGIGFSGGGIRSASINLGITQTLHRFGVFDHLDYMSTVSGGGYLGSSISTLMRSRTKLTSEIAGTVRIIKEEVASEIAGTAKISKEDDVLSDISGKVKIINTKRVVTEIAGTVKIEIINGDQVVVVTPIESGEEQRTYRCSTYAKLAVINGEKVFKGQLLIIGDQVVVVTPRKAGKEERIYRFSTDARLAVEDGGDVNEKQPLFLGDRVVVVTPSEAGEKERTYRCSGTATLAVADNAQVTKGQLLTKHPSYSKTAGKGEQVVVVTPNAEDEGRERKYLFSADAKLNVRDKENVSAGKPLLKPRGIKNQSEIAGTVNANNRERTVTIQSDQSDERREYRFSKFDWLVVKTGDTVAPGQELIQRHNTIGEQFRWRVRPIAFLREMLSMLDETHPWVNVSDGGHIENLATIELLRRRCKYIIIGDGEADPDLSFNGLATLMRCAYIDLGIEIDIDLDAIRLRKAKEDDTRATVSGEHWAIGTIKYPAIDKHGPEEGYLLYLKSSFTDDGENEVIQEYRRRNPTFPHETTADQFFDEGQFEAYRALGQHIGERALKAPTGEMPSGKMSFAEFEQWFTALGEKQKKAKKQAGTDTKVVAQQ